MTTGFNEQWSNPDNFAGAGVAESVAQFADSCSRASEGDVAEVAMNGAALGLDLLGAALDPLGSLATAGIGWLIEHVSFLREPLDWFAGDPDEIKAACATWNEVAMKLDDIGTQQDQALQRQVQSWEKAAAEAFRQSHGQLGKEMHAVGAACTTISDEIANAGAAIGAVRGMIRDLISTFVWEVIRNAAIALATSAVTFGGAAAAFAAWTVGRASMVLGKVTKFVTKIMGFVGRMLSRLKGLFGKVGDLMKGLKRFDSGGSTPDVPAPTRTSGAADSTPATPASTTPSSTADSAPSNRPSIGQRMEDWGRQKSDPVQQKYNNAGNVYEAHQQRIKDGLNSNRATSWITKTEAAVDQYSPFKPKETPGHTAPHSRPDIANNGLATKFSGDLARELAKSDEMQNQTEVNENLSQKEEQEKREQEAARVEELRAQHERSEQ